MNRSFQPALATMLAMIVAACTPADEQAAVGSAESDLSQARVCAEAVADGAGNLTLSANVQQLFEQWKDKAAAAGEADENEYRVRRVIRTDGPRVVFEVSRKNERWNFLERWVVFASSTEIRWLKGAYLVPVGDAHILVSYGLAKTRLASNGEPIEPSSQGWDLVSLRGDIVAQTMGIYNPRFTRAGDDILLAEGDLVGPYNVRTGGVRWSRIIRPDGIIDPNEVGEAGWPSRKPSLEPCTKVRP